jgi:hypothetical protein
MPTGVYKRPVRVCSYCGVTSRTQRVYKSKALGKTFCNRHYLQTKKHGAPKEWTVRDRNTIIPCGDYYEIVIKNSQGVEVGRAKVDSDDIERCLRLKWRLAGRGYAYSFEYIDGKQKHYKLHILIMGKKDSLEIDHINRDKLDNRKSNLRFVTHKENTFNQSVRVNNKSGIRGISYDSSRKKWIATIGNRSLGRFKTKDEAIEARVKAEQDYF